MPPSLVQAKHILNLPIRLNLLTISPTSKQETLSISEEATTWHPNFEVNGTAGETATLIIISNSGVKYPQKREDPIFPAERTFGDNWYYGSSWRGGVLGCIDRKSICSPDGQCEALKYRGNINLGDDEHGRVMSYLYLSLLLSSIGSSITYRKAEGLGASSKVVGDESLGLDAEQWKVEVLQLFQTSLARIQIYARNIARGNQNIPIYGRINGMDGLPRLRGLCNMYKFKSIGWRNINVVGFLSPIGLGLIFIFLCRMTEEEEKLRVEEYYIIVRDVEWREVFTKGWHGVQNRSKIFLSWIGKIETKCRDKLKKLRDMGNNSRIGARAAATHSIPNVTGPRISDGIEL
jgi:hypothetical protein